MKQSSDNRQVKTSNRQIFRPQLRGMNHPIIVRCLPIIVRSSRSDTYANGRELLRRFAFSGNVKNSAIPSIIHQMPPIIHQRAIRHLRNVRFSYVRSNPALPDNPSACGLAPCYRSSNRQAIVRSILAIVRFANELPVPVCKSDESLGVTLIFRASDVTSGIISQKRHQAGTKSAPSRHQVLQPIQAALLGISPSRDVDATSPTDTRLLMTDSFDNRPVFFSNRQAIVRSPI